MCSALGHPVSNLLAPPRSGKDDDAPCIQNAALTWTFWWRRRSLIQTRLSCGTGSTSSAHIDRSRRSDPNHLDAGDGVVVVVLGDDRDSLDYRGGGHEHVEDRDPAPIGAQDGGDPGELARHLGVYR